MVTSPPHARKDMRPMQGSPGVSGLYFSANDIVFDWSVAFLESVRSHNPDLPIALIPFNDRCDRLANLAERYGFSVYTDASFSQLEEIGRNLELGITPHGRFWFRRFAAFWGPFERFLYLDCRTLVLCDLGEFVSLPLLGDFDLLHFDCAVDQVYEVGDVRRHFLSDRRARGFNSGRWASRKNALTLDELQRYGEECLRYRDQMNRRNTDQFFLNYCCDAKPLRTAHFADLLGGICQDAWARQSGHVYYEGGTYRRWDHGGLAHRKRVPLLHWAGIGLSVGMPECELFFQFRDRAFPYPVRLLRRIARAMARPLFTLANGLRRHRRVNRLWHWLRRDGSRIFERTPANGR